MTFTRGEQQHRWKWLAVESGGNAGDISSINSNQLLFERCTNANSDPGNSCAVIGWFAKSCRFQYDWRGQSTERWRTTLSAYWSNDGYQLQFVGYARTCFLRLRRNSLANTHAHLEFARDR